MHKHRLFIIVMFTLAVIGMLILTACQPKPGPAPLADSLNADFRGVADGPIDPPGGLAVATVSTSFTVEAIDPAARTVTLRNDGGAIVTYICGTAVRNFDQIRVGDRVHARVTEEIAVFVGKKDSPAAAGAGTAVVLAPLGEKPGVEMVQTAEVVDKVDAVDPANHTITLHGVEDIQRTFHIDPNVNLDGIMPGDDVVIRYAQGLALLVEAAPAAKIGASPDEIKAVAEEAIVYGLPLVVNYGTIYEFAIDKTSSQYKAPFNMIRNDANVFTPKDTAIVTPNSDTPYSVANLDLRAEPVVLSVPAIEKSRYYSVQLVDMYTFNYGYVGSRTTGNDAGNFMIAGPNWNGEPPAGVKKVFRCETDFSLVIIRTQLFSPADIGNIRRIQAGYKVQTLSQFTGKPAAPAAKAIEWPRIDKKTADTDPFPYLNFVLQFCPAPAEEKALRAKLATIGIEAGKPFDAAAMSKEQKEALVAGAKAGMEKAAKAAHELGKNVNGWHVSEFEGSRAVYNGDWLKRAAVCVAGVYGNDSDEAMYPMTRDDSVGQPLDGEKGKYAVTFPAGQLPPVNAFWSVTMYDGKTQLLVENPINRYLVNSPMLPEMKKNADGSLTIYIQHDSPGKDKESNWLPAPAGPIYLVMRLYWPKPEALKGEWKPPGVTAMK